MSTTTVLNKYRVFCTAGDGFQFKWDTEVPTVCPLNSAHSIDTTLTTVVDTVSNKVVTLREEAVPTQGYYKLDGYSQSIPAGAPGAVTSFSHSWPFQVSILNAWFIPKQDQVGDSVDVTVAPNTVIGALAGPASVGATTLTVTSTVLQHTVIGFHISLTDGVNTNVLGRVIAINPTDSTITVETPTTNSFSPLSPTYVLMNVKFIENLCINCAGVRYVVAEKKIGGKGLPPNVPMTVMYHNSDGLPKTFCYNLEYIF